MKAIFQYGEQETVRYTPSGAVSRNDVVIMGTTPGGIAGVALEDIAANVEGAICVGGVFSVEKTDASDFSVGETVYYNATEDPFGGVAESGACTDNVEDAPLGVCVEAAGAETEHVLVKLGQAMTPSS